jgi:multimeric flavodoxin WrbA
MKALLLDGAPSGDDRTTAAADAAASELARRGCDVERLIVRELDVRPCTGCFGCWVKRPGECVVDDDARGVARKIVAADVYAIVSPVRWGTYDSETKRVLDRSICVILPFFTMVNGEIHHEKRYERYPSYVVVGTLAEPDEDSAAIFRYLVDRNAINMHSPTHASAVVTGDADPAEAVRAALDAARIGTEVFV